MFPPSRPGQARTRSLVAVALFAGALLMSTSAQAEEPTRDDRVDPSAYPPDGTRGNLFLAGAVTTGVWYGAALSFSYLWPDAPGARDLRIPIAGPWLALADTGCADNDPNCSTFMVVLRAILTTIDGVGQAGGILVMAESALLTTAKPAKPAPKERATLRPASVITGDALGLGLVGSF